jgi:hypothetical protein
VVIAQLVETGQILAAKDLSRMNRCVLSFVFNIITNTICIDQLNQSTLVLILKSFSVKKYNQPTLKKPFLQTFQVCFKKQCEKQEVIFIDDDENVRIKNPIRKDPAKKSDIKWISASIGSSEDSRDTFYQNVEINKVLISVGDFILVRSDDQFTPGNTLFLIKLL